MDGDSHALWEALGWPGEGAPSPDGSLSRLAHHPQQPPCRPRIRRSPVQGSLAARAWATPEGRPSWTRGDVGLSSDRLRLV